MRRIILIGLALASALTVSSALAVESTPTPTPAALSITKTALPGTAVAPGSPVGYTIVVTNSGGTDALVDVGDDLPNGITWLLGSVSGLSCNLAPAAVVSNGVATSQRLDCTGVVPARHIGSTDFVNGVVSVTVTGNVIPAAACGSSYANVARVIATDGEDFTSNVATITTTACPTPTATSTPVTPTPSAVPTTPTATATVPVATQTPVIIVVHDTPSPSTFSSATPLPPSTGTGVQASESSNLALYLLIGSVMLGLTGAGFAAYRRR